MSAIDDIASAIWHKGYEFGRACGRREVLDELAAWSGTTVSPPDAEIRTVGNDFTPNSTVESGPDPARAPTAARAWKWLKNRPDGASYTEWMESGQATDHAALWRLAKGPYVRQDPATRRYYAV